ncbi:ent-kaurene oxidase [Trichoderma arundinaceum]|uniref:Ent-kaurene oxidase n=1 Tax=Trichoderma arundinaceum TaxID=490622 RepID=A0A395NNN5_TRIAR|nr:ent-kaurene oxidase [Trichoderma arundinaceum]
MFDILLQQVILAPAILLLVTVLYQLLLRPTRLPNLPIIGAKEGEWFPLRRARLRNTDLKKAIKDAYSKYKDQAVILPLTDFEDMVLLPASDTQFVTDQPESVLSMHESVMHRLQTDYTCMDPKLIHNPVHIDLITTTLTKQIGNLVPDIVDETKFAFEKYWGKPDEFTEICVYDTIRRIIGLATNRVLVGTPICRDPALLDTAVAYAKDLPPISRSLRLFWKPIRPLVAPYLTRPLRIHTAKFEKILLPEIKRRLMDYETRVAYPETKSVTQERNDFLEWSIEQAKTSGDPYLWQPETLAGRIHRLNNAAIHTSSFSVTGAVLDLAASRPEYIDELREEISTVLAEHDGEWNKQALAKMEKLDSVFRESVRLNSFVTVGLNRVVTAKGGVTTPSGVHIPKGASICVPSYAVLQDSSIYEDAQTFKPFRFAEARNEEGLDYVQRARKAFATTSTDYLVFGHGRNACPGRFFAANELKLILAYLVMNYDIEQLSTRPRNMWLGLNRIPSFRATIRIKRRNIGTSLCTDGLK